MKMYVRGDVVPIRLDIQYHGEYVDPDDCEVTVWDPTFTEVVNTQAMTRKELGKFFYTYESSSSAYPGVYLVHAWANVGTAQYGQWIKFRLREG